LINAQPGYHGVGAAARDADRNAGLGSGVGQQAGQCVAVRFVSRHPHRQRFGRRSGCGWRRCGRWSGRRRQRRCRRCRRNRWSRRRCWRRCTGLTACRQQHDRQRTGIPADGQGRSFHVVCHAPPYRLSSSMIRGTMPSSMRALCNPPQSTGRNPRSAIRPATIRLSASSSPA